MIVKRIKDTEIRRYRTDDGKLLGMAGPVEELEHLDILQYNGVVSRRTVPFWTLWTAKRLRSWYLWNWMYESEVSSWRKRLISFV